MAQILIVDDEPEILEIIQDALSDRGFQVKATLNDVDALALLEREAAEISVLVADVNLGEGVTGFDIARRARQLNPAVTVIYVTGNARKLEQFAVPGGLLLEKPFDPHSLAETVTTLIDQGTNTDASRV